MIQGGKTRMTNDISFGELKKAYLQSANIVAIYGERYLPIFERLEKEYKNRKQKDDILTRAISISKSNHIN